MNGQKKTASQKEIAKRAAELRTQGRKGCKAVRINMAFTPDNHRFLKMVSKASGLTMTELCNHILDAYQKEHPNMYQKAKELVEFVECSHIEGGIKEVIKATDKADEKRREYYRRWRKEHPDKVREYNRRYWQSVAERGTI